MEIEKVLCANSSNTTTTNRTGKKKSASKSEIHFIPLEHANAHTHSIWLEIFI